MRVLILSILATLFVVFIISINIVIYVNFYGLDLIQCLLKGKEINIWQIVYLFFVYIIINISVHIPFLNYSEVNDEEEYAEMIKQEISNLTYHITKISIITVILITAMYYS